MIAVRCKGGLGNQFFQYAAARALAARHNVPLSLDKSWYERPEHQAAATRTFDLPEFAVAGTVATASELEPFRKLGAGRTWVQRARARLFRWAHPNRIWHDEGVAYNAGFAALGNTVLLEGYFQHPAYFTAIEHELRRELRLRERPPEAVCNEAERLGSCPSVGIQVRRTDFVSRPEQASFHGACSVDYFRDAWRHVRERVPDARGVVFTDDPAWAMDAFRNWPGVKVMNSEWNGPRFLHKFHLMQACRHFIIANSTWGWWAAWLGARSGSVVVMPERWYADPAANVAAKGLRIPGWEVR